ncbi:MAG: hypothetical protein M1546_01395 [Chloroflexi bacterium]|nr:hypothetical protein [Chloroflexota bacterium]
MYNRLVVRGWLFEQTTAPIIEQRANHTLAKVALFNVTCGRCFTKMNLVALAESYTERVECFGCGRFIIIIVNQFVPLSVIIPEVSKTEQVTLDSQEIERRRNMLGRLIQGTLPATGVAFDPSDDEISSPVRKITEDLLQQAFSQIGDITSVAATATSEQTAGTVSPEMLDGSYPI